MYRAISVAQRSGLTTMAFWHCKYTVILLNNANDYPEKMHKYVVEHKKTALERRPCLCEKAERS